MPQLDKKLNDWVTLKRRNLVFNFRKKTWQERALPDFIIIGVQKGGTSSLFYYLAQHPQFLRSFKKEIHYFDGGKEPDVDRFAWGEPWYRAHFPYKKELADSKLTFEASPLYMFSPLAPERIHDLVPKAKIIALLRNPVERAISHYFHEHRKGREPLPIFEALQKEEDRLADSLRNHDYKSFAFLHQTYKSRGLYREQLERYFQYFDKEQVLVMSSEEFFSDPATCLERTYRFLGVNSDYVVDDLTPRNVGTNRAKVDPKVYEYLDNYFEPHNKALSDLLDMDFGW